MDIIEALKVIIARSPAASREAIRTIQAANAGSALTHPFGGSKIMQVRYTNVLQVAFSDPEASFTAEERAQLADAIEVPDGQGRDYTLRVRLTEAEHAGLQDAADAAGQTISAYARARLFEQEV